MSSLDGHLATLNSGPLHRRGQLETVLWLGQRVASLLLKSECRGLRHLCQLTRLEVGDLAVKTNNGFKHILRVLLLFVAPLLEHVQRLLNVAVEVFEDLVGLRAAVRCVRRLPVDERAEEGNAAVLFAGLVAAFALGTDERGVSAVGFQMGFQARTRHLCLFACSASHLLLRTSFPMIDLLRNFEWRRATHIGAVYNSKLALAEQVRLQVLVRDRPRLARVVEASECGSIEECLLDWVHFTNVCSGLLAILAGGVLSEANTANQFVALVAVASVDGCVAAVSAEGGLDKHGVGPAVELLQARLHFGPVVSL